MSDELDDVEEPALAYRSAPPLLPAAGGVPAQVPRLIAEVYGAAAQPLRAKLLECLLRPVGPMALVVIAAGAFGGLLQRGGYRRLAVSLDDAARVSATQILELARFVEQCAPEAFQQVGAMLVENRVALAAIGGCSALILLLRALGRAPAAAALAGEASPAEDPVPLAGSVQ